MANIFSSLGTIPIMETVQGMLQRQQNIRNSQILGDYRQQEMQQRAQEMQERQATMKALQQDIQGGIQSQIDKSTTPSEDDSPVALAQKNVRSLQSQFQMANQRAASIVKEKGSLQAAEFYQRQASELETKLINANRELRLEQRNQLREIGGAAGALKPDGSNFDQVYNDVTRLDPNASKKYAWDRDVNDNPVFGETSKRTLSTIAHASMTAKEQSDQDLKAQKFAEDEKIKELQRREAELKIKDLDAKVAIDQVNAARAQKGLPLLGREGEKERLGGGKAPVDKSADRLQGIADREPTNGAVDSARAAIRNEFKGEFDDSIDSFARSVAAKTNEIRAEAAKKGEPIELDEARDQAIATLSPFVKSSKVGGVDIPVVGHVGGKDMLSFQRAGVERPKQTTGDEDLAKKLSATGLKFGLTNGKLTGLGGKALMVENKAQYDALPSGTVFVDANGKQWTKP